MNQHDTILVLFTSVGLLVAFITLYEKIRKLLGLPVDYEKKKSRPRIIAEITLIFGFFICIFWYAYTHRIILWKPPIPEEKPEIIDISGSFFGYTINNLGKKNSIYLLIENRNDSIIGTMKFDRTEIYLIAYDQQNMMVSFDSVFVGKVEQKLDEVIIEDINEPIKWRFSKRLQ